MFIFGYGEQKLLKSRYLNLELSPIIKLASGLPIKAHMKNILFLFFITSLNSCTKYNSKWNEIKGTGIMEGETLNSAIYFQDTLNGIIGGYKLIKNENSKNFDKLDIIPVLYLTKNGGKDWKLINIENAKDAVNNVFLSDKAIICQIDSVVLKSNDLGLTWNLVEKSSYRELSNKYFSNSNQYKISNHNFKFENTKYRIKERYKNKYAEVIVCYGKKEMTDYYFITRNNGMNWEFLQDESGSNKKKYLLKDEYLYAFDSQYGLQKLKLN